MRVKLENIIKQYLILEYKSNLLEGIGKPETVGINGPISESDLVDDSVYERLSNEFDIIRNDDYDDFDYNDNRYDNMLLIDMYRKYVNAMSRRRPDDVASIYRFYSAISRYSGRVFNYKDSYVVGRAQQGFFVVSHFAPASLREGMEMLSKLFEFDNIIVLPTEDLAGMLERLNIYYKENDITVPMVFRDKLVNKRIFTTNKSLYDKIKTSEDIMNLGIEKPDGILNNNMKPPHLLSKQEVLDIITKYGDKLTSSYYFSVFKKYPELINKFPEKLNKLNGNHWYQLYDNNPDFINEYPSGLKKLSGEQILALAFEHDRYSLIVASDNAQELMGGWQWYDFYQKLPYMINHLPTGLRKMDTYHLKELVKTNPEILRKYPSLKYKLEEK